MKMVSTSMGKVPWSTVNPGAKDPDPGDYTSADYMGSIMKSNPMQPRMKGEQQFSTSSENDVMSPEAYDKMRGDFDNPLYQKAAADMGIRLNSANDMAQVIKHLSSKKETEESDKKEQPKAAAPAAAKAAAAPVAAAEPKPFNASDYAPAAAATSTVKTSSSYLDDLLTSLNTSNIQAAANTVKSTAEPTTTADTTTPAEPVAADPTPAQTEGWARYAAQYGYGPDGNKIMAGRKASSGQFLNALNNS